MSLLFPITSILGETTGKIIDKLNFNKNKIGYRPVIVIGFLVMLILTILFLIITDSPYPSITTYGFILITTMIFLSTLENITDTIGLSKESLSLREPISNFGHLMAALIAFFIFESERDPTTLLFVFIGVLILLWVNTEKHHLQLFSNEGTKYFVYGMVLSAIIVNIYKAGLEIIDPVWLFFFRMIGVFILTAIFLRFDVKALTKNQWRYSIYAGIAYFIGSLTYLFSIQYLGLLTTILLLMLAPASKYIGSYLILKEHVTKKEVIGSLLLISIIIISILT